MSDFLGLRARRLSGLLITALLVLVALLSSAAASAEVAAPLSSAETWLLQHQHPNGSFGESRALRSADSALATLAILGQGATGSASTQALIYLDGVPDTSLQARALRATALHHGGRSVEGLLSSLGGFKNGGGMGAFATHQSTLLDTAAAVEAMALDERAYLLDLAELLDYLQLHQGTDGGWGLLADDPSDTWYSAEILLALTRLDDLVIAPSILDGASSYLASRQQADGSFGDAVETALAYRALVQAGKVPADLPYGSPVAGLLAAQGTDGSWGADVFTTAQVMLALQQEFPDLRILSVSSVPESVIQGSPIRLVIEVANRGPVDAPDSALAIYRGSTDGELLAETNVAALVSGATATIEVDLDTATFEDALDVVVQVDSRAEVREVSERNNEHSYRLDVRKGPDPALFPSDIAWSVDPPRPDESFELWVTLSNLGDADLDGVDYEIVRLEADVPVETLGSGTAGAIVAGGSRLVTTQLTLPEGEHEIQVTLDPQDLLVERSEDDNVQRVPIFVYDSRLADFEIADADVIIDPADPAPGESVTVSVTVHNRGEIAGAGQVSLEELGPSGATEIESFAVDLEPGTSTTLQAVRTLGADAFAFVATADPAGSVPESDESNNRGRHFFRDLADLAIGIDNLELSSDTPLEGDPVEIRVTVRNQGRATATAPTVELWADDPDAGGSLIESRVLGDVPAAGNRTASFTWPAAAGRTDLVVVLDPQGAVDELDESNNRLARRVSAQRSGGANLTITTVDTTSLVDSAVDLSLAGTVTATVWNDGDVDVDQPFGVRLFVDRDADGLFGEPDDLLAAATVSETLAAGASTPVDLSVAATTLPFHRPVIVLEVDVTDVVAERLEDDNQRLLFADCAEDLGVGVLEPVEEWFVPGLEIETAPIVVQLSDDDGNGLIDGRDVPDVVFHTIDGSGRAVVALSGLDGSRLWTFRSSAANPLVRQLGQVAAADLDGDGVAEVIAMQRNGRLAALDASGELLWVSDKIEGVAERSLGGPSVADLDGDGVPEIVVGRAVVSNTGSLLALGTANRGRNYNYYGPFGTVLVPGASDYPHSVVADIDLDGRAEIVAGDTVYRFDGSSLEVVWDKVVADKLMVDGFSAVGQLDGDPEAEIVYVSSNQIMVLEHDGSTKSSRRVMTPFSPAYRATFWGGPPTIADLNGDGKAEILVATDTELIAFKSNLSTYWRRSINDVAAISGITAFDFDGDGDREVLHQDNKRFRLLDGRNGSVIYSRYNTSKTGTEYPVVADVDGDGSAEILLTSNKGFDGDTSTRGLRVLGHPTWRGTRGIWNQYGYQVTNVQADGTVPSDPLPSWRVHKTFRTNVELEPTAKQLPNLTVGLPRVGEEGPDGAPVVLRVGNGGLVPVAPGVAVALYAGAPSPGDEVGLAVTAEPIPAGQWIDVEVLWTLPAGEGVQATAVVDPELVDAESTIVESTIAECDEADNSVAFEVVASLLPDLAVPGGGVEISGGTWGGRLIPVEVTVRNDGSGLGASVVDLWDGAPEIGTWIGRMETGVVAPGSSVVLTFPWDTLGASLGARRLHAVVDPDDTLLEATDDNNIGLLDTELTAPTQPDLELVAVHLTPDPAVAGGDGTLGAEVRNRGLQTSQGFEVAFLIEESEVGRSSATTIPAQGESVVLSLATVPGLGPLDVAAIVDPSGSVAEGDEGNNRLDTVWAVDGSGISVAVTTDQLSYASGDNLGLELTLVNDGAEIAGALLRVEVQAADGLPVATLFEETVTLASGAETVSLDWTIQGLVSGTYSLVASIETDGQVQGRGYAGFSLREEASIEASVFTDRDLYAPTQTVLITGRVSNSGNQPRTNLIARLRAVGAGGTAWDRTLSIPVLYPGSSLPISRTWSIDNAPAGDYDLSLTVEDDGGQVASAAQRITVEDTSSTGAGLRGDLVVRPNVIGLGGTLHVAPTIENAGNADLLDLPLRLDLIRLSDGTPVSSDAVSLDLSRDELLSGSVALETAGLEPGDYLLTLVASLPGRQLTLDRRAVTLEVGLSVSDAEAVEGGDLLFTVDLSASSSDTVTVDVVTRALTAAEGVDYSPVGQTLTFAPGETTKTVTVSSLSDATDETHELLHLALQSPVGAALGRDLGLGTILDESACAGPNFLTNGEGGSGTWFEREDAWDVSTGSLGRVYASPSPASGIAALAPGSEASAAEWTQEVSIAALASRIDGAGLDFRFETLVWTGLEADPDVASVRVVWLDQNGLELDAFEASAITTGGLWSTVVDERTAPVGARSVSFALRADGQGVESLEVAFDRIRFTSLGLPVLWIDDVSELEGNGGTTSIDFEVRASCALPVAVDLELSTSDGTATAPDDYTSLVQTVSLAPGQSSATVTLTVVADDIDESDETFGVQITPVGTLPSEVALLDPTAAIEVLDDDAPATLSALDLSTVEGAAVDVTVALSAVSGKTVTVNWATRPGTASEATDFAAAAGTLSFPPGITEQTVSLAVVDDAVAEGTEVLYLDLSSPVAATLAQATATIELADNDVALLNVADLRLTEGDDPGRVAAVPVTLSVPSALPVEVSWTTVDGTARAGADYQASSGLVTLAPGAQSAEISIPLITDLVVESEESFSLELSLPTNAVLASPTATVVIVDDDALVATAEDAEVSETDGTQSVSVEVSLQKVGLEEATVDWSTVDGTAVAGQDYVAASGTLTFPPGFTSRTVTVQLVTDTVEEPTERFTIALSNPNGVQLLDAEAEVTIIDDDQFYLNGEAWKATSDTRRGCVGLTPNAAWQSGSAWRKSQVDLSEPFDRTFRTNFGAADSGSHGMVFLFQDAGSTALGGTGYRLGYIDPNIAPSFGVKLDTYDNGPPDDVIPEDHLGLVVDGGRAVIGETVPALIDGANVETDLEYDLRVIWNPAHQSFDVRFDGERRLYQAHDLLGESFAADSSVFYGFTGATGGDGNRQYFCESEICVGTDALPGLQIGDVRIEEGHSGETQMVFPVTLTCPTDHTVSVAWATEDHVEAGEAAAAAGSDYLSAAGTLIFQAGERSKEIVITALGDLDPTEPDETFVVRLSDPVGAELRYDEAVGTLLVDDLELDLQTDLGEGDASYQADLVATISAPISSDLEIDYSTADLTAIAGIDYEASSGTLVFPAGSTQATLTLTILGNTVLQNDRRFALDLVMPAWAPLESGRRFVDIRDDDVCPTDNLLVNPDADEPLVGGEIPGWQEIQGSNWTYRTTGGYGGGNMFFAGVGANAQLGQVVDVSQWAESIDAREQFFKFTGWLRVFDQSPRDTARYILEFRAADESVLESFDTGEKTPISWTQISYFQIAPPGTRSIRVRMVAKRNRGDNNDGYFDALDLRTFERLARLSVDDVAGLEGQGDPSVFEVPVRLNCAFPNTVEVDYLTSDGTARAGEDFEPTSGRLVFAPQEVQKTVPVTVFGDLLDEGEEDFYLDLASPVGGILEDGRGRITIQPDETMLSITPEIRIVEGNEGAADAAFTVTLEPASSRVVTVDYRTVDDSATAGEDYAATAGTLTFAPGTITREIRVPVYGDTQSEADESFVVELSEPGNASILEAAGQGVGVIVEDDLSISISNVSVFETDETVTAELEVRLSTAGSEPITVDYFTEDGTAVAGEDYVSASGTLTFAPGETVKTVWVDVIGDEDEETSEDFYVVLDNATVPVTLDEATVLLLDDDGCMSFSLIKNGGFETRWGYSYPESWTGGLQRTNPGPPAAYEGSAYLEGWFNLTMETWQEVDVSGFASRIDAGIQSFVYQSFVRSLDEGIPDRSRVKVEYRDENGGVVEGFDTGEIVNTERWERVWDQRLAPPGTRSIRVRLFSYANNPEERNHGFHDAVSLRAVGVNTITLSNVTVDERLDTEAVFDLSLSCPVEVPTTLGYQTVDDTAVAGQDYLPVNDSVVVATGEQSVSVVVPILNDGIDEPTQRFHLQLTSSEGAVVWVGQGTASILDDDPSPRPVAYPASALEGDGGPGNLTFEVRLDQPSETTVNATVWVLGGTATAEVDFYSQVAEPLVFSPGQTVKTVDVLILGDTEPEGDETLLVKVQGYSAQSASTTYATILDDDGPITDCDSPNLLINGGAELGGFPSVGWTPTVAGLQWPAGRLNSGAVDGHLAWLSPDAETQVEMFQDVDVSGLAAEIDGGSQSFRFSGWMRTRADEANDDQGRFLVEYRDGVGTVLDTYDSGDVASLSWTQLTDQRVAPVGTRTIRVRLLATENTGLQKDVAFDALSLRSLDTPVLTLGDVVASEADGLAEVVAELSCVQPGPISATFTTRDGTAVELEDYTPSTGTVTFATGTTRVTIQVPLPAENEMDPDEVFYVDLSAGDLPIAKATGAVRLEDDQPVLMDLIQCFDASHSITPSELALQYAGLAEAVEHVIPHDGSVRLTAMQFNSDVTTALRGIRITEDSYRWVAERLRSNPLNQDFGSELGYCLTEAAAQIEGAWPPSIRQVIDASSDGQVNYDRTIDGQTDAVRAGIDVFNAIGIDDGVNMSLLRSVVFPRPDGGPEGFVVRAETFGEFAQVLGEKIRTETAPNLVVEVSDGRETALPGDAVTYVISVANHGSGVVTDMLITGVLPAQLEDPAAASWSPSEGDFDPTTGRWSDVLLAPGESLTLEVSSNFAETAGGTATYEVSVHPITGAVDILPFDNTASDDTVLDVPATDLALSRSRQGSLFAGQTHTFELVVTNLGPIDAVGPIQLVDTLDGLSFVAAAGAGWSCTVDTVTVTCDHAGPLAVGQSLPLSLDLQVTAAEGIDVSATATVGSGTAEAAPANNTAVDGGTVQGQAGPELYAPLVAELLDDADGDGVASPGDTLRYRAEVQNPGGADLDQVTLVVPIPDHAALVAGSAASESALSVVEGAAEVTFELGLLAVDQVREAIFDVRVDDPIAVGVESLVVQGAVDSDLMPSTLTDDPALPGGADPTVTTVTATPRLVASMVDVLVVDADGNGDPSPGDTLEYRVELASLGNVSALAVDYMAEMPSHTSYIEGSFQTTLGTLTGTAPLALDLGDLAVGTTVDISYRARVDAPIPAEVEEIRHQGFFNGSSNGTDLVEVPTDDPAVHGLADETVTPLTAEPMLALTKRALLVLDADADGVASPGDELLYSLELSNTGNAGAAEVVLTDVLPVGATLVDGSLMTGQGTVLRADSELEIAIGTVASGGAVSLSYRLRIDDPLDPSITALSNQATVTYDDDRSIRSDDPDTATAGDATVVPVVIPVTLTVSNVAAFEPIAGEVVTLDFRLTLDRPTNRDLNLDYQTVDGTATAGIDYTAASGSVVLAAGELEVIVPVTVLADDVSEADVETLVLDVGTSAGQVVVVDGEGRIVDTQAPPTLTATGGSVDESAASTDRLPVVLNLSRPSAFDVSFDVSTTDGTATGGTDYAALSTVVTIPAGQTTWTLEVEVFDDVYFEGDETVEIVIGEPTNAIRGRTTPGTIVDDDVEPSLGLSKIDRVGGSAGAPTSPGGEITYDLVVSHLAGAPATELVLTDVLPTGTSVAAGSVTTSQGTVTSEDPVTVELGELGPSAQATVSFRADVAADLGVETELISNQASIASRELDPILSDDPDLPGEQDPTSTQVVAEPNPAAEKTVILIDRDGDGLASPGDRLEYRLLVSNASGAPAIAVEVRDDLPPNTTLVDGTLVTDRGLVLEQDPVRVAVGDLVVGDTALVSFQVELADPWPAASSLVVINQGIVSGGNFDLFLTDDPGTPAANDATTVTLIASAEMTAVETVVLAVDQNTDGDVNPGDVLEYTVVVENLGDRDATGVSFSQAVPAGTTLVAGSLTTSTGSVIEGDPMQVVIGPLAGRGGRVDLTFRVLVDDPLAAGTTEISAQGTVSADGLSAVATDDPTVAGSADPTVVPVVASPDLHATKTDLLVSDLDGDGLAGPGDRVRYEIRVTNDGDTGATSVNVVDVIPDGVTVVLGTETSSHGSPAISADGRTVETWVGDLPVGDEVVVTFEVELPDPLPLRLDHLLNQAVVESAELGDLPSDDPDTPELGDPTRTVVAEAGRTGFCVDHDFAGLTGWQTTEIGDALGSAQEVAGGLEITSTGSELYHGDDHGVFVHRAISGDFRVEVDLASLPVDVGGEYRKACLMVRSSTAPDAARAMACYAPDFPGGAALMFDARASDGGTATELASNRIGIALPTRLSFVRRGDELTVGFSEDGGTTWVEPVGALGGTVALTAAPASLEVGLMVASYDGAQPMTAAFDGFRHCRKAEADPPPAGDPVACTEGEPVDVVYVLDLSESMTSDFPGADAGAGTSKLSAALLGLERVQDRMALRADGSRTALLTFHGQSDPAANLAGAVDVPVPLTGDMSAVSDALAAMSDTSVAPLATTPTGLALEEVIEVLATDRDPTRTTVVVLVTDGVPNIDRDGRGHHEYRLPEIQAISLLDDGGAFLPWTDIAWLGRFNGAYGTFDGEPLANAVFALDRLVAEQDDLMVYGVGIQGDGVELGSFNLDLVDYAAWVSGGMSFAPSTHDAVRAAMDVLIQDLECGAAATGGVGDRVWNDLDADGVMDAGEPGLPGVTVEVLDDQGALLDTTTTDWDGVYAFTDLPVGSVTVRVDAASLPIGLSTATYDIDGDVDGGVLGESTVSVTAYTARTDVDFGYAAEALDPPPTPETTVCSGDGFDDPALDPVWTLTAIGGAAGGAGDDGDAVIVGDRLELTSNGSALWGDDRFHFLHRPAPSGDFRVEVEIADVPLDPGGNGFRKGGLHVRSGLDVRSSRIMVNYLPHLPDVDGPALQFGYRLNDGGTSASLNQVVVDVTLPVRLAIERRGTTYTAWYSYDDGLTWQQETRAFVNGVVDLDLGASPVVGVGVASYDSLAPMTFAFDDFAVCEPDLTALAAIPPAGTCDPAEALDVALMLDVSGSMGSAYGGAVDRLDAALNAVDRWKDLLAARGDGSRAALVVYDGGTDPAANLSAAARILAGLGDPAALTSAMDALSVTQLDADASSAGALALQRAGSLLQAASAAGRRPVVVWLSDEPPTVDGTGLGPYGLEGAPLDFVLDDGQGGWLPPGRVAWSGPFFGDWGTFAGEPVADAMAEVVRWKTLLPGLRIVGLGLDGDGVATPVVGHDLHDFAAAFTSSSSSSAADLSSLLGAVDAAYAGLVCP